MVPLHGMFESVLHSNTREISKQDAALLLTRAAGQMDCEYLWRNWLDVVARLPMPLVGDKYNPELDGSKDKIVKALKLSTKDIKGGKGPWNKEQRLMFTITDELSKDHTTDLEDQKKALDVLGKEATLEVMLIQGMASSYCGIARGMHVALETNTIVADSIRKALVDDIMYV